MLLSKKRQIENGEAQTKLEKLNSNGSSIQRDKKNNKRFSRSKKYEITYENVEPDDILRYYKSKLKESEIKYVKRIHESHRVNILIEFITPLQLHMKHKLVVINDFHYPVYMKNFPRKNEKDTIADLRKIKFYYFNHL